MDKTKQGVFDSIVPYIKEVERKFRDFTGSYEHFTLPEFGDMTEEQENIYKSFMKNKVMRKCEDCGKVTTMNRAYDNLRYKGKCRSCRVQKLSLVNTISGLAYQALVRDCKRGIIFYKGGVVYIDRQASILDKYYLREEGNGLHLEKSWFKELFRKDKVKPCKVYGDTIVQTKPFCKLVERLNDEGREEFDKKYLKY